MEKTKQILSASMVTIAASLIVIALSFIARSPFGEYWSGFIYGFVKGLFLG